MIVWLGDHSKTKTARSRIIRAFSSEYSRFVVRKGEAARSFRASREGLLKLRINQCVARRTDFHPPHGRKLSRRRLYCFAKDERALRAVVGSSVGLRELYQRDPILQGHAFQSHSERGQT